ncbi:CaiB/BaiF CoA transferase family protein [Chloroflexota bacterium]
MYRALEGIKVVQTASTLAGPMAARLLADWGADVIWVEQAVKGDLLRSLYTKVVGGRMIVSDVNYRAENVNRNKRGMSLNLAHESGREIIYKLLENADVYLSNFRERELKKFKLEYETLSQLNPRLICANIDGYGKKGPDKDLSGTEFTGYFARSGILHTLQLPGSPPIENPIGLGDHVTGLALAHGIVTALYMREKTGVGQQVDTSLFHAAVFTLSYDIAGALVTGQDRQAVERKDISMALHTSYETKDGKWLRLGLGLQADLYWPRFCQAIGREDLEHDPRFETFEPRVDNHLALFNILEEVFRSKTLDEWKIPLNEKEITWAPVQNLPEVITDPQARANDFYVPFDHPTYGRIEVIANPVRLSMSPEVISRPAPEFNQHTEEILLEHGYTWEDIKQFKEQGVIA